MDENRLLGLDYLRGISALLIMLYHYLMFSNLLGEQGSIWHKFGVYGVSLFYILSGLTLYYVYCGRRQLNFSNIIDFYKKRLFRIHPLLILVCLIYLGLNRFSLDILDFFIISSGLFGFIDPALYSKLGVTGAWSIGNELVFYSLFPLFWFFSLKRTRYLIGLFFISIILMVYFSFFLMDSTRSISTNWVTYINPFNQIFYFLGGFCIGHLLRTLDIKKYLTYKVATVLFILSLLGFAFFPMIGSSFIFSWNRIIFSPLCMYICMYAYVYMQKEWKFVHRFFLFLGQCCYSIYLLHPIVWRVFQIFCYKLKLSLPPTLTISISVMGTFFLCYFVYHYFERFFIKLAHKV